MKETLIIYTLIGLFLAEGSWRTAKGTLSKGAYVMILTFWPIVALTILWRKGRGRDTTND
jgi:hypothetical protein